MFLGLLLASPFVAGPGARPQLRFTSIATTFNRASPEHREVATAVAIGRPVVARSPSIVRGEILS